MKEFLLNVLLNLRYNLILLLAADMPVVLNMKMFNPTDKAFLYFPANDKPVLVNNNVLLHKKAKYFMVPIRDYKEE